MTPRLPRTIVAARQQLAAKSMTPQQLVDAMLQRVARHDGAVASFLHIEASGALIRATEVDVDVSPLAGIPLAFKDIFDVAGMPTTNNSRLPSTHPTDDAPSVAALRGAGGIFIGKLAAWECGMGGTSFTLPWPPARNPWDVARDPGGSSTGSAAAIASGFCLGSLGSDTGGSIREPASWCGIAGLKPTYGLVPTGGVMPASFTLDHVGPMARTSEDCALLLDALLGTTRYTSDLHAGVAGLRIAIVDLDTEHQLHLAHDVASALDRAARALSSTANISRLRLPSLFSFSAICTVLSGADGAAIHRRTAEATPELYDPLTLQRIRAGRLIATADYAAAGRVQDRMKAKIADIMSTVDLLLMPTTRDTAPVLGAFDSHGEHPSLNRPWNVTGLPALSVRAGFDRSGLPIGLQVVGHRGADALVLRAGHAIESLFDGRDAWPEIASVPALPKVETPAPVDGTDDVPASLAAVVASAVDEVRRADVDGSR